jgi:hypothetical protein
VKFHILFFVKINLRVFILGKNNLFLSSSFFFCFFFFGIIISLWKLQAKIPNEKVQISILATIFFYTYDNRFSIILSILFKYFIFQFFLLIVFLKKKRKKELLFY